MRQKTSKLVRSMIGWMKRRATSGLLAFHLTTAPVPASRPRVSRWGTYYGKNYTRYRKIAGGLFEAYKGPPTNKPVVVLIEYVIAPPKTTKRSWPRGDVDNYAKSTLDSMTKSGRFWRDDDQVIGLSVFKRFAAEGEDAGEFIYWFEMEEDK